MGLNKWINIERDWCPECDRRTLKEVEEDFWVCGKCGYNEDRTTLSKEEERNLKYSPSSDYFNENNKNKFFK